MIARSAGTAFGPNPFLSDAVSTPFAHRERAQRAKEAIMRVLMRPAAAILLIAAGLLSVPAANAQVQSPSPGLSDPSPNIPDQKLDAAAAAIERVASLKQEHSARKPLWPAARSRAACSPSRAASARAKGLLVARARGRVHRPRQGARAVRVRLQGLNCHTGHRAQGRAVRASRQGAARQPI